MIDVSELAKPQTSGTWLDYDISLFTEGTPTVSKTGAVTGTFKKVEDFTGFNKSNPTEQSGYYFAFKIPEGAEQTVKMKRTSGTGGRAKTVKNETDYILRLTDEKTTVYEITVGEKTFNLSFNDSTFNEVL